MIKSVGEGGRSSGSRFSEEPELVRAERTVLTMDGSEAELRMEVNMDDVGASGEGVREGSDSKGEEKAGGGEKEWGMSREGFSGESRDFRRLSRLAGVQGWGWCSFWHRRSGTVQVQCSGRAVQVRVDDGHDRLDRRAVDREESEREREGE